MLAKSHLKVWWVIHLCKLICAHSHYDLKADKLNALKIFFLPHVKVYLITENVTTLLVSPSAPSAHVSIVATTNLDEQTSDLTVPQLYLSAVNVKRLGCNIKDAAEWLATNYTEETEQRQVYSRVFVTNEGTQCVVCKHESMLLQEGVWCDQLWD